MRRRIFLLVGLVGLIVVGGVLFRWSRGETKPSFVKTTARQSPPLLRNYGEVKWRLRIGEAEVEVEVAQTPEQKALGLGGREELAEDEGMLFVFETSEQRFFWMKEMRFALDFVFIDKGKVVELRENVLPPESGEEAEIERVVSHCAADWVLEVGSGWVKRHKIMVEDWVAIVES